MASTASHTMALAGFRAGTGRFSTPVIADGGGDACVVVVWSDAPLALGSRFEFAGLTWEIVRARDMWRGFVAWPVIRSVPS